MTAVTQRRPGPVSEQQQRHLAPVRDQPDDDRARLVAALAGIDLDDEDERAIRKLDREALAWVVAGWLEAVHHGKKLSDAPPATRKHLDVPRQRKPGPKRIVLFLPDGEARERRRWMNSCTQAAERARGSIVAIAPTWAAAEQMLATDQADSIMVARHEHLPAGRVLVGADVPEREPDDAPGRQRRPRPVLQDGSAWR